MPACYPGFPGPAQAVGVLVNADHVRDLELIQPPQLGQQVGADVAGTDDRGFQAANTAVTEPRPANVAVTASPGTTGIDAVIDPGRTTSPVRSVTPCSATVLASQTSAFSG